MHNVVDFSADDLCYLLVCATNLQQPHNVNSLSLQYRATLAQEWGVRGVLKACLWFRDFRVDVVLS